MTYRHSEENTSFSKQIETRGWGWGGGEGAMPESCFRQGLCWAFTVTATTTATFTIILDA